MCSKLTGIFMEPEYFQNKKDAILWHLQWHPTYRKFFLQKESDSLQIVHFMNNLKELFLFVHGYKTNWVVIKATLKLSNISSEYRCGFRSIMPELADIMYWVDLGDQFYNSNGELTLSKVAWYASIQPCGSFDIIFDRYEDSKIVEIDAIVNTAVDVETAHVMPAIPAMHSSTACGMNDVDVTFKGNRQDLLVAQKYIPRNSEIVYVCETGMPTLDKPTILCFRDHNEGGELDKLRLSIKKIAESHGNEIVGVITNELYASYPQKLKKHVGFIIYPTTKASDKVANSFVKFFQEEAQKGCNLVDTFYNTKKRLCVEAQGKDIPTYNIRCRGKTFW